MGAEKYAEQWEAVMDVVGVRWVYARFSELRKCKMCTVPSM